MVIHVRMHVYSFLFLLLVQVFCVHAVIHDVYSMRDIFADSTGASNPALADGTPLTSLDLVLFDLDNTVIEPDNDDLYGGDVWLTMYAKNEAQLKQMSVDQALHEICLPRYFEVQSNLSLRLVEPIVANHIRSLQDAGVVVFALTSRSKPVMAVTMKELPRLGIDFSRSTLATALTIPFSGAYPAEFVQGIFFGSSNKKSALLTALVSALPYKPQRIIFIDDKKQHTEDVGAAAEKLGVAVNCYRYGHLDEKVRAYTKKHELSPVAQKN